MHIPEGVLSTPVLAAGAAVAAGGVAVGLKRMDEKQMPAVAVLSSAFFVASLIHAPIPGSSVHLILNGLIGLVLGFAAFPAILVALTLQCLLFGFGGLTTLGVNTVTMALPGVVCYGLFHRAVCRLGPRGQFAAGFGAGALAILMSGSLVASCLYASGREFLAAAKLVLVAHLPVMLIEGFITGSAVVFLRRVRPEVLLAASQKGERT